MSDPAPRPRVAIMQPTFLPWLGYFALMAAVDRFVYLDDVQLSRQSWQTRNRLKGPGGEILVSLPVARKPARVSIRDARISDLRALAKLRRAIADSLGRAPHFRLVEGIIDAGIAAADNGLCALNIALIEGVAEATGIATPRHRASDLGIGAESGRAGRLLDICRALGGRCYVSPPGALDYLEADDPFSGSDVALRFIDFHHPEHPQFHPPFLPFIAAIDALAHVGPAGFRALLERGTAGLRDRNALMAGR